MANEQFTKGLGGLDEDAAAANAEREPGDALRDLGIEYEDAAAFVPREIAAPKWIIPDFIAKHYQCALYGKSKSKKTFFGLNLAEKLALGQPFLKFPAPPQPCRVAYFNLELMPYFMQERMRRQLGDMKDRLPKGRFFVFNLRGKASVLRAATNPEDGAPLVRWLKQHDIDLAVVDPRYKLMLNDEDENTAAGLRALLEFRTSLAEACAVLLVGHDPKGDVSTKSMLDRGAGSYTAIADDDATILLDPNTNGGDEVDAVTVRTIHRNREPLEPFAAVFDGRTTTFAVDDAISADTNIGKGTTTSLTASEKARRNEERFEQFKTCALELAEEYGDDLRDCTTFKLGLLIRPKGTVMGTSVDSRSFKFAWKLLTDGDRPVLKKCKVLEVKENGANGNTQTRREFVSTPERIDRYLERCNGQGGQGCKTELHSCPV